jgi:hypothetical protein
VTQCVANWPGPRHRSRFLTHRVKYPMRCLGNPRRPLRETLHRRFIARGVASPGISATGCHARGGKGQATPDRAPLTQILLYQTEDRRTRIEVRLENETVWLNQLQMTELFQTSKQNVSLHIQNIFQERELEEGSVVKEYLTTAADGKSYRTKFYNLDVIISVGYRVKSHRGTQFRIWATQRLREYLIKGFALDDERLKQLSGRSSTSTPPASTTTRPTMGLTSWSGGRVRKADVTVAKNYLDAGELDALNRIVNAYLEFAELQARGQRPMYMRDWIAKLDDFLRLSERDILTHAGRVSHEVAIAKAEGEFEEFQARQLAQPNEAEKQFEAMVKELKRLPPKKPTRRKRGTTS